MKNPRWHRDEIILALDLYFDPDRGTISHKNPRVIALSKLFNELPFQPTNLGDETFRNPNGVSMKLSNFLALDPDYHGKGMDSYSSLDKEVFFEFYKNKDKLHRIASEIRAVVEDKELSHKVMLMEPEMPYEALEGEILFRLHKVRERDGKLIFKKKQAVLKATGKLECEVCQFDFFKVYGELGKGFIECHHKAPLHLLIAAQNTTLKDLALVCANCHRMLHKSINIVTIESLKKLLLVGGQDSGTGQDYEGGG